MNDKENPMRGYETDELEEVRFALHDDHDVWVEGFKAATQVFPAGTRCDRIEFVDGHIHRVVWNVKV